MVLKVTVQKESLEQSLFKDTSEAAVRRCSSKQMFLEISHIHKKASVLDSMFNKVAGLTVCNII